MSKWIRIGLVAVAVVVLGGMSVGAESWAQDAGRWTGYHPGGEFGFGEAAHERIGARLLAMLDSDHVKNALGLSDDQTNRLRQIVVDTQKSNVTTGAEMKVRGIELRELMRVDNPDRDAVMKKIDQISALRTQMLKQDVDALLKAKTVLTPEQQKKIRAFIESHAAMGGGAFGRPGMNPGEHHFGAHPPSPPVAPATPKPPDPGQP